jgi:hypothetical protein
LDRAGEVQVEREISVASLRREGWNNCDCECTDSENLQHHRGLVKVEVEHRERERVFESSPKESEDQKLRRDITFGSVT